jgi:hypothetical protein
MRYSILLLTLLAACGGSSISPDVSLLEADGGTATSIDHDGDGVSDCADCAPMDPNVFPLNEETCNGVDDDCDAITDEGVAIALYADCDGDTWASSTAVSFFGCEAPSVEDTGCSTAEQAWTSTVPEDIDVDWADADPRAHRGATAFETDPVVGAFPETDYDFDCDLEEELEYDALGSCSGSPCVYVAGWETDVPECGASESFIASCDGSCDPVLASRAQGCR